MESHIRSIFKAVSWRIGGTLVTFAAAWLILGEIEIAAKIGVLDTLVKIGAFYFHERLWNRIHLGKLEQPDYEI